MAFISADLGRLERAARAVDDYVRNHRANMNRANSEIMNLGNSWQGSDFNQFRNRWNTVTANGSSSSNMISSLENYSRFLRFAAGRYRQAQTNAVNRANSIPRN